MMPVEELSEGQPVIRRAVAEDAVAVVRRAVERAHSGAPLLAGEEQETQSALAVLERRLRSLKARGAAFGGVELSAHARRLASGTGPLTLAS